VQKDRQTDTVRGWRLGGERRAASEEGAHQGHGGAAYEDRLAESRWVSGEGEKEGRTKVQGGSRVATCLVSESRPGV
jgi:hypothetical protein